MSERAAAFGALNPPKVIEHNGKTYSIAPVMTEGTLLRVEAKLYERAKKALLAARDLYTADEYSAEVAKLRARHEAGDFAFTAPATLEHLETAEGAALLLSCMMNADLGEIVMLLAERPDELQAVLSEAVELSFPKLTALPRTGGGRKPAKKSRRR